MLTKTLNNRLIVSVILASLLLAAALLIMPESANARPGLGGPIGPVPLGPIGIWPL